MINSFSKLFLMMTSIAPIGVTYAFVAFFEGEIIKAYIIAGICALLTLLTWLFISWFRKNLSAENFTPESIEAADNENIAFMLLYLFPLLENGFNNLHWYATIPAILIFAVVIWTGYGYHFNPLFGLLGWHFYKVTTHEGITYVLISRKQIRTARKVMSVALLTEYIVIDMENN